MIGKKVYTNEKLNFFDLNIDLISIVLKTITGVHTQHIESYWNTKKTYIKAMKGCRRTHLQGYLNEFMWRDRFNDNA